MKIRTQFMISTVLLGSFLLLVTASEIITNLWVQSINKQEDLAAQIEREAYELGYLANDYLLYHESQQAERWESKFASFSENLSKMQGNTPEQQALLVNINAHQQRLQTVFTEIRTRIESPPQTQDTVLDTKMMQVSWSRLEVQNQSLIFDASRLEGLLREQEDRLRHVTSLLSFLLVGMLGAFILGSYGLAFRRMLLAITELQTGTQIIGSGNLDYAIAVKNEDEISELSRSFNQMTANLKEVTASKADLEREIFERSQIEKELRLSEKKFALAFANNPAAISLTRLDNGLFLDVNETWLDLIGYSRKEVIGHSARKLPMWPMAGDAGRFIQELRDKGMLHWREQEFRKKSGETFVAQLSAQLLPIQGELMILSTLVDITERKQAEEALRQTERRLVGVLESMPDAFVSFDAEMRYTYVNANAERLQAARRENLIGKDVRIVYPDAESYRTISQYERALQEQEPVTLTSHHAGLNGWVEIRAFPTPDGVSVFYKDVSAQVKAERALRESETRFRLALKNAPVSLAAQDRNLRYVWAYNERTANLNQIIDHTDHEIFTADEAAYFTAIKQRVLEEGVEPREQMWLDRPNGRTYLDICWEPIRDNSGNIVGVASATVDLTPIKLAEQALRDTNTRLQVQTEALEDVNNELQSARLAALNLIEDILRAQEELEKINAKLRESEQRLNRAQEIAHLGSWELDLVNDRLSWSDEVYRIFGLQPQEFGATYEAFLESVHPDDRAAVDEAYAGSIREGRDSYEIDHRVVRRSSGEIRSVHEKCEHFRDETGRIIRSVGMVHDVTERKRAEQALRESEQKYRNLFENMTEEVHFWRLVKDSAGKIKTWRLVDANPPTLKTWGRDTIIEIEGKTTDEIFGPGATEHYMPVIQKIMAEGIPYSYEDYFPHLDKHFRFTSVPLGEYFITTGADITSLKKAHEALRQARDELELRVQERTNELEIKNQELLCEIREREEAERQLRIQTTAMESAANGILISDFHGKIIWVNPALTRMTGYTEDELIGQNTRIFNSGVHNADYYRQMWDTIMGGEVWKSETTNRRKDGSTYIEEQTITPVRNEVNEISHFIAIKHDVTEQKQIQAALEMERARLKNILDTIPDGVYIVNRHFDIEYINPVIEKEFGPVGGKKCHTYFHNLEEPCPCCRNESVLNGILYNGERTYAKNHKSYEIFDAPIANMDGSISKLKILHDITRRKKMELNLEQRNVELQAATSAERKQRQAAESLRVATQALTRSLDLDTVLNTLIKHMAGLVERDIVSIGFVEDETRLVSRVAMGSEMESNTVRAPIFPIDAKSDFFFQKVALTRKSVVVRDATREPDWINYPGVEPIRSWLGVPILVNERVIGVVLLGKTEPSFFTREHARSAEALVSQAAVAIQNAWLFEQVRAGRERLQLLSRRLVEVQESERRYIARELHDQAGQSLSSLILGLGQLEKGAGKAEHQHDQVRGLKLLANDILEDLHRLAVDLRPASLDHLGLVPALSQLINSFDGDGRLDVKFKAVGLGEQDRLPAEVESTLYRIVQEALTNVLRHAQATHADVLLEKRNDGIVLIVEDNGIGFDPAFSGDRTHLGLIGIRERTEMLGGKLIVESIIGNGTLLVVEVPNADSHPARG